jgi:hypothetical protein
VNSPARARRGEARGYYLKFDLVKSSIAELPELVPIYQQTGAARACLVFKSHGAWERATSPKATHIEETRWCVIKIPSLDGTELWIVPAPNQAEVERKIGFGRPSASLLSLSLAELLPLVYRDPLFRHEVRFDWKSDVICTSMTGVTILSPTDHWTLEQLESLKDLGCFAFED